MENVCNTIGKDFEEFLQNREGEINPDIIQKINPVIKKIFMDAGAPLKDAQEKLEAVFGMICDHQEAVYFQGIKDGAQLLLHLLGMAPENRKEAS